MSRPFSGNQAMKLKLLIVVLALQTAWILGTTLVKELALAQGKVILLEPIPVDPRDLLRGDYLILRYKISEVPTNLFISPLTDVSEYGKTVYVALTSHGQFYEVSRASTQGFKLTEEEVLLKGKSRYRWWASSQEKVVYVDYGLERYYVHEGAGNPRGKITVQAAVPASGQAIIKQVFLDGKPYAEAMKAAEKP
jgi:uncharacterized membrane-anchored protein